MRSLLQPPPFFKAVQMYTKRYTNKYINKHRYMGYSFVFADMSKY
jgi:hypothetical protein